jgi:hypothetical protein
VTQAIIALFDCIDRDLRNHEIPFKQTTIQNIGGICERVWLINRKGNVKSILGILKILGGYERVFCDMKRISTYCLE